MNQRLFLLLPLVIVVAACRGRADATCLPGGEPVADGVEFNLPHVIGTIRLPVGTVGGPLGANPDGRRYVLQDSTVLEVWLTDQPAAGLAASGTMGADSIRSCDTQIGGFATTVTRAAFAGHRGDSLFVGLINITMDSEQALNVAVTTANRGARDQTVNRLPGLLRFQ